MAVEIAPHLLHHEPGTDTSGHRCEPRVRLQCRACRRQVVYCTSSETVIELSIARRWRCDGCAGVAR